jgi:hypothetical protein
MNQTDLAKAIAEATKDQRSPSVLTTISNIGIGTFIAILFALQHFGIINPPNTMDHSRIEKLLSKICINVAKNDYQKLGCDIDLLAFNKIDNQDQSFVTKVFGEGLSSGTGQ